MRTISRHAAGLFSSMLCVAFFCGSCSENKYQRTIHGLNTVIDVTLYSSRNPSDIFDSLQRVIAGVDSLLSISNPSSDVWNVNHRNGPVVCVRPVTASLTRFCEAECDSSGGLFDITVAPLKYLYGLESHRRTNHVPNRFELDSVRRLIGCGRMRVLGDSELMLDSGVTIDFGGIGKGYLFTLVKDILVHAGERRFLVNIGGDLIARGDKPDGRPWNVGIQHPRVDSAIIATLSVSNTCVFSSGDYKRYFIENGVRYHHLFDPRTAEPGRKNQSATAIGADPLLVDVCVKAAFLLDAPKALEYLCHRKLKGVIIDSAGKLWASAGLENVLQPDSKVTAEYR
jgi:thiamine biosynthesis lipoprotein